MILKENKMRKELKTIGCLRVTEDGNIILFVTDDEMIHLHMPCIDGSIARIKTFATIEAAQEYIDTL
jgi:hypothetical protein